MSRIGKAPVEIPAGVEVNLDSSQITVKGPGGQLAVDRHPKIEYRREDSQIVLSRVDESRIARMQHGLRRTLLFNAVEGVSKGFVKTLEVVGVGYRMACEGNIVTLTVGYSNPVKYTLPAGITGKVEGAKLRISGIDKQLVGEVAAQIRKVRPPEPFKGKGIKYEGEIIRRKAGKSGKK